MGYLGCESIEKLGATAQFVRISSSGPGRVGIQMNFIFYAEVIQAGA